MINHNTALSSSMNLSELAPKAATAAPARGEGAFGEALAGARGVIDRRESHEAAGPSRRDWAHGDRSADRPTGQDRAAQVRSDGSHRTERTGRPDEHATTPSAGDGADAPVAPEAPDASAASEGTATATTPTADPGATSDQAPAEVAVTVEVATTPAASVTVAVAAAPVADPDAIVMPTTGQAPATTDALDAAIRMAITGTSAATTTVDAAAAAMVATVDGDAAASPSGTVTATAAATAAVAQGVEDAEGGDVQAGPTSPSTSRPATTSGPSPVQLAAATLAEVDAAATAAAPVVQAATQVAQAATVQVAEGDAADAGAQLVQAAAVTADDAPATDADAAVPTVVLKAKAEATSEAGTAADPVDVDVPEAVQAARLNQQQAPTVSAAAQLQAAAQAKAAEAAGVDEGGEAAAPKLDPLPAQAAPVATTARTEGGIRVREGLLNAHQQVRIDHIAEQLATRLRLSHAAGGSQVQLSLKPRELGDVTVQMQVRDGIVAATVLVDRAETARTMQSSIEDLRRSLEQQGLSIQEFSVDVRGESGAGGANARAAAEQRSNTTGASSGSTLAGAAGVMPGFSGDDAVAAEDVHDGDVSVLA